MSKKNSDVHDILQLFMDDLVTKSIYLVFEKPTRSKTINLSDEYRPESKSVGSDRRKSVNWVFQLFTPSHSEVTDYIKGWTLKIDSDDIPSNPDEWKVLILQFFDNFVQDYFITERPLVNKDDTYHLGYRPSKKRVETKLNFFMKSVQPSRDEIEVYIDQWLGSKI